jgi:hypothetical protein
MSSSSSSKQTDFSKSFKDTLKRLNMIDDDDDIENASDSSDIRNIISSNSANMSKYVNSYVPPPENPTSSTGNPRNANGNYNGDEYSDSDVSNDIDNDDDNDHSSSSTMRHIPMPRIPLQPPQSQHRQQMNSQSNRSGSSSNARRGEFDEDEVRRAIQVSIQDYEQKMTVNSNIAKEQARLMFEASKIGMNHEIPEELYNNEHIIEEIFRTFNNLQSSAEISAMVEEQDNEYEKSLYEDELAKVLAAHIEEPESEPEIEIPIPHPVSAVTTEPVPEAEVRVLSRAEIAAKRLAALSKSN